MTTSKPRVISGRKFAEALRDAGIVTDLNTITRIVIEIQPDRAVEIQVYHFGDERLLSLAPLLSETETG